MSKDPYTLVDPEIEHYAEAHSSPEASLLQKINRETHLRSAYPQMLSGHLQGAFLGMISKLMKPTRVVEIGTFMGYSTICLAQGLTEDGEIITIDNNPEIEKIAGEYFKEAGLDHVVNLRIGDALDILPSLEGPFDLAFIDADKENYTQYYELLVDKISPGGLILADNTLWYGRVIDPEAFGDRETASIRDFNRHILEDPRVENILLPFRDGLTIIRKL